MDLTILDEWSATLTAPCGPLLGSYPNGHTVVLKLDTLIQSHPAISKLQMSD